MLMQWPEWVSLMLVDYVCERLRYHLMADAGGVHFENRSTVTFELEEVSATDERAEHVYLEGIGWKRPKHLMSGGIERADDLINAWSDNVELRDRVLIRDEDPHADKPVRVGEIQACASGGN